MDAIRKVVTCEVKEVAERTLEFTGSTEALDRDGEVILAKGWELANYKKNPVFLWAHNYMEPPIGRAIEVRKGDGALQFQIEFADRETYEKADTIHRLYQGGFLKAVSVGFIPHEWEDGDGVESPRRTYKKQELLELSAVSVPSNPEALVGARESGIITVKEFKSLTEPEEKPYENEHACRLRNPDDFQADSFRRTQREHEGKKYSIIMGRLKGETTMTEQAYRYPKDTWGAGEARSHCKTHDGTFEAARQESLEVPEIKERHEAKLSQAQIKDELDYAKMLIAEGNLSENTLSAAWDIIRMLLRFPGGDIPVDIIMGFKAEVGIKNWERLKQIQQLFQAILDATELKEPKSESWDCKEVAQLIAEQIRESWR